MALILRLIVNAVALWVTTLIVPGITLHETAGTSARAAGAAGEWDGGRHRARHHGARAALPTGVLLMPAMVPQARPGPASAG